ncbi:TetR/AcrR family transcriptional regulator [Glycomyces albidus]|jgi:AcrR family transcriptional regulator|uniref:TetR family transcriptional regulator n=1 Tax=Glycomyces albidus TaxID=2656774 RepID=A0A6L5G313_9ACTN|nr:TetR/AcrR family transcriptional regulator [Glycomyces albidus]MQM24247.1 TetR family transcriptional regulator [Glycomyces albidus]
MSAKRLRTRERLSECALDLFEAQGFAATSVAQIANAAGVTEMTFFRHFGSKEQAVLTDPFDPAIAEAVGARPAAEAPVARAARGLRAALAALSEADLETARRRVRIVAATPELRGAAAVQNETTAKAISDRLSADGAEPLAARVAAAAVLAAVTAALYAWAEDERTSLTAAIATALDTLEHGNG